MFVPIDSVLKDDDIPPTTNNTPGHLSSLRQSKSENDDTSPVFDSRPPIYKYHDVLQSLPSAFALDTRLSGVPIGVKNRSSSNPSDDYSYCSRYMDNPYRSRSYDSIQPGPYNQQYQHTAMANCDQTDNPHNLAVGSVILYGNPSRSGVIKWLGNPIGVNGLFAGIEMV